jgi:alkylation response protein AidB-like acyl-CoA dehydrogenase
MYMNPLSVGRSFVAMNNITSSASALAIAIRYTGQRRQFSGPK